MNNPQAIELALSYIQDMQSGNLGKKQPSGEGGGGAGGARDGAGKPNNGKSHAQQQGKTNNKQQAKTETEADK